MLRLSETQFQAFRDLARERFVCDTSDFLKVRFSDAAGDLGDVVLCRMIEKSIEVGKRFGVTSAFDVRRLSECLLLHGADFPFGTAHDWARDVLENVDMSGREKMNALMFLECFNRRP